MGDKKDYCTMFPDHKWGDCCKIHDNDYGINGVCSRKEADKKLKNCLKEKGYKIVSIIIYIGVRTFGWLRFNYNREIYIKDKVMIKFRDENGEVHTKSISAY